MSTKGFQTRLFLTFTLLFMGNCTYASGTIEQLESINLSEEFVKTQTLKDFRRRHRIQLSALKTQEKRVKQKNMSKKFGPLLIGFKVRSARRAAVGFNIDVLETLDIIAQRDPSLFFKTDNEHFILSPDTRDEVKRTLSKIKDKFGNMSFTNKKATAQLI